MYKLFFYSFIKREKCCSFGCFYSRTPRRVATGVHSSNDRKDAPHCLNAEFD